MEILVIGVVAVLLLVTVVITCILCCFSYDSKTQDPQGGPGHSFTVATFRRESSFFTRTESRAQPLQSSQDFWITM
ncbi:small regulatory polypeptide of amino acid response-like [Octodon degus]|uniref:Small regulatory polypeptide of amino acid response-like n=1 Tax=Octodon degus TaxID=10160 RepID=A0A6P6EIK3_OCTDE|nr:small regulatory polypeptide of amino acid response-like [Octodon degus]